MLIIKEIDMNKRMILVMGVVAAMTVACDNSDDVAKGTSATMMDKGKEAVVIIKNNAADMVGKSKELVTEKAKSAAQEASAFVQKGTSNVVEATSDVKEVVSKKVQDVKDAMLEKAAGSLSGNDSLSGMTSSTDEKVISIPATAEIAPSSMEKTEIGK